MRHTEGLGENTFSDRTFDQKNVLANHENWLRYRGKKVFFEGSLDVAALMVVGRQLPTPIEKDISQAKDKLLTYTYATEEEAKTAHDIVQKQLGTGPTDYPGRVK